MGRSLAALCLGAITISIACNRAVYFDCGEDEQCSLDGQQGICLAGECAYPNPLCPSMYAYPSIARPGVAGRCVEPSNEASTITPGPTTTDADSDVSSGEPVTSGGTTDTSGPDDTDSAGDTDMPAVCEVEELDGGLGFTCARVRNEIYCWGANDGYQLGNPKVPEVSAMPVLVPQLPPAVQLATGRDHACVVTDDGSVYCWGRQDGSEVIGEGGAGLFEPTRVNLAAAHSVSAGSNFSCAALGGGVTCWGDTFWGQTGTTSGAGFNQVLNGVEIERVVSGRLHTCARRTADRSLTCWGGNDWGQLGRGGPILSKHDPQPTPMPPVGLRGNISSYELGETITCATDGNTTACWGQEDDDQLLGEGTSAVPVALERLPRFDQLALADRATCGRTSAGQVHCWGANNERQVDPQNENQRGVSEVTSAIAALSGVTLSANKIGAGAEHVCLAAPTGVACWGNDEAGQLGDRAITPNLAFVSLPGCE